MALALEERRELGALFLAEAGQRLAVRRPEEALLPVAPLAPVEQAMAQEEPAVEPAAVDRPRAAVAREEPMAQAVVVLAIRRARAVAKRER